MNTIKLYYDDPYMRAFDAVVTDCVPEGKRYLITLDRTAFYPEGGGQPCDLGRLSRCWTCRSAMASSATPAPIP